VKTRDVGRQLTVLATALHRISSEMPRLWRSVDSRRLVGLDGAAGAGGRLRRLQRQLEERR
jgi:hypothetical protein